MLKKYLFILIVIFSIYHIAIADVSIGVKPLRTEMVLKPGDTKTFFLDIINNANTNVTAVPTLETIVKTDELGYPISSDNNNLPENQNISKWITFKEQKIVVPANGKITTELKITVPSDAEPGGHYAAIYYEPQSNTDKGVAIKARVASLILITVEGDIHKDGRLIEFNIDKQNIFGTPINFKVLFENTGTIHLKPTGKIVIKDSKGNQLTKIARYIDPSTGKENILDYIPVNNNLGNVLPGTNRNFISTWNENYIIDSGKYTAQLDFNYGDKNESKKIDFEINPEINITKFDFIEDKNTFKKQFVLNIQNTGNFNIDLHNANLKVLNIMDYQVDNIRLNTNTGKNILDVGQTLDITVDWDKKIPEGEYKILFDAGNKLKVNGYKEYKIGYKSGFFDKVLSGDIMSISILLLGFIVIILLIILLKNKPNKK